MSLFQYLSHHSHLCGVGLAGKLDRHPTNCKLHLTAIRCRPCHDEKALQLQASSAWRSVYKSRACKTRGFPNSCWEAGSYNRGIPESVNSWAGPRTRLVTFYEGLFSLDTSFAGSGVPYVLPASEGSATLLLHGCEVRYYCHCDSRLRHRGPPS